MVRITYGKNTLTYKKKNHLWVKNDPFFACVSGAFRCGAGWNGLDMVAFTYA